MDIQPGAARSQHTHGDTALRALVAQRATQLFQQEVECAGLCIIRCGELEFCFQKLTPAGVEQAPEFGALALLESIVPIDQATLQVRFRQVLATTEELQGALAHCLPNELELAVRFPSRYWATPHVEQGDWDDWGTDKNVKAFSATVLASSHTICAAMYSSLSGPKDILVLGAGNCLEVTYLIEALGELLRGSTITVMDSSQKLLDRARLPQIAALAAPFDIGIKRLEGNFFHLAEIFGSRKKPDFILAQGIFDRDTLNFPQGFALAHQIKSISSEHTLGFFTAYGLNLFDQHAWESAGFYVHISSLPKALAGLVSAKPDIYVVQNLPDAVCKEIPDRIMGEVSMREAARPRRRWRFWK
jgi:hypothetical protein